MRLVCAMHMIYIIVVVLVLATLEYMLPCKCLMCDLCKYMRLTPLSFTVIMALAPLCPINAKQLIRTTMSLAPLCTINRGNHDQQRLSITIIFSLVTDPPRHQHKNRNSS